MCLWLSRPRISRLSLTRLVDPFCLSMKLSCHAPYTQQSRYLSWVFIYCSDCAATGMVSSPVSIQASPLNGTVLTFPGIPQSLAAHSSVAYALPICLTIGNSAYMDRFASLRAMLRHFCSAFSLPTNRVLISLSSRVSARYKDDSRRSACHLLLSLDANRNRACDFIFFISFCWPKRCVCVRNEYNAILQDTWIKTDQLSFGIFFHIESLQKWNIFIVNSITMEITKLWIINLYINT